MTVRIAVGIPIWIPIWITARLRRRPIARSAAVAMTHVAQRNGRLSRIASPEETCGRSEEDKQVTGPIKEHYFSADPSGERRDREVSFHLGGRDYALVAASGVFSAGRLDPGTAVLLRKGELPKADTSGAIMDLGCGYGPIATVLATVAPNATVWAVDVNARARDLARQNTKGLRVTVVAPDEVPDDVKFRQIWSNPPVRIGKPELHALLQRWLPRLEPDGVAWLVVGKHLGADSLQDWLNQQGWPTLRHASGSGFRVLKVTGP